MLLVFVACRAPLPVCDCPDGVPGHAVVIDGSCSCLPHLAPTPLPEHATRFDLGSGDALDWDALDAALAEGDVVVHFARSGSWERLTVERTDPGPHRLVLDGGSETEGRATVAGVQTPFDERPRHRVTVRGFEITGSRDKGIYWAAGDDVLIEDVVVHENRGTPSIYLEYSSRTGVPSTGFVVRNVHIYDQRGECLYVGGAEGTDAPSHRGVVLENNLIHDCFADLDTKHDAINVKDRIEDVRVHRNVVLRADWGIEVASPGSYTNNVVIDTDREGFQVSDAFSPIADMTFIDNVVLRPGHDGFHLATDQARAPGLSMSRNTVIGARRAGVLVASGAGMDVAIEDMVVLDSAVAFDGWGDDASLSVERCRTAGNGEDFARIFEGVGACQPAAPVELDVVAGPDGLFFTDDDPWLVQGGASLP